MGRTTVDMVAEFHKTFGHPIAEKIGDETEETRKLRIRLLFEELEELAEATDCRGAFLRLCEDHVEDHVNVYLKKSDDPAYDDGDNVDHVAELDALCDLQVVLTGKYLTSGHYVHIMEAFKEVHRSNMSKACKTKEEASHEIYSYTNKGINVHKEEHNGLWALVREDGKILKGPHFEEPNLKGILEATLIFQEAGNKYGDTLDKLEDG